MTGFGSTIPRFVGGIDEHYGHPTSVPKIKSGTSRTRSGDTAASFYVHSVLVVMKRGPVVDSRYSSSSMWSRNNVAQKGVIDLVVPIFFNDMLTCILIWRQPVG
jgi:hypothetical protein